MQKASSISIFTFLIFFVLNPNSNNTFGQSGNNSSITIKKTTDFTITGEGTADNWSETEWVELIQFSNHENSDGLVTRAKILYTDKGMYFFFEAEDETLTTTMDSDFMKLWQEDVVEVFLWPNESETIYFEYEISPMNYELPILVANNEGDQSHWIPYDYSYIGERKTLHETSVEGGEKESGASVTKWKAEFFIPFELLRPLKNNFPESGTRWRANFYRIDYDHGSTHWAWQPTEGNFHEYEKFGTFIFE